MSYDSVFRSDLFAGRRMVVSGGGAIVGRINGDTDGADDFSISGLVGERSMSKLRISGRL